MKYKIVKLKIIDEKYKKIGLNTTTLGLVLEEKSTKILVMFFNNQNQGDYLTLLIDKKELELTDMELPQKICEELEEYILKNVDKIAEKTTFKKVLFEECDFVELTVEKDKYSKYGVHKGDRGVVASNKAVKNTILVEFNNETDKFDGFLPVEIEDIQKIK